MDSVLAELIDPLLARLHTRGKALELTRDQWTSWDIKIDGIDCGKEIEAALQDPNFVSELPVIPESPQAMKELYESRYRYHLVVVTNRPTETKQVTESWLHQHFLFHDFVSTREQGKRKAELPLHVLVDDDPKDLVDFASSGGPAVILTQPWNRIEGESLRAQENVGKIVRCADWRQVLLQLERWRSSGVLARMRQEVPRAGRTPGSRPALREATPRRP